MITIEVIRRIFATLQRARRRAQTRKQLLALDAHLLTDIGVSRDQAQQEGNKPFWRR